MLQSVFRGGSWPSLWGEPAHVQQPAGGTQREGQAREALRFMFSPSGSMFREFLLGA